MRQRGYEHKPIMAVWSFKRKMNPTEEITKYKACLCCHSGQTVKGIHYQESFLPVVSWSTIRFMLTMAIINNWYARQVDFVLAFPQAKVRTDIYMQVPEKFEVKQGKLVFNKNAKPPSKQDVVEKLIQNVYGLVDASYTWHLHLKKGLLELNFKQSKIDPCLFYKDKMMFLLHVDDAICLSPRKDDADKLIKQLADKGYVLADDGPLSMYLGMQIKRESKDKVSITQPAFIEQILKATNLKDQRMHDTPADQVLRRDENNAPRKNEFHY